MTTIELIENRITDLEKQVFGLGNTAKVNKNKVESPVIDSLLHVNTLISSAVSGREKTNAAIKRLPELNNYLDPIIESSEIPAEAELQLILAMEKDIKRNYDMLNQMKELMPVLEIEHLTDIPELTNRLNDLNLSYLKVYEESEDLNANVYQMFNKYNEVITSISKSLITLDVAVTAAEIAAKPKKQID